MFRLSGLVLAASLLAACELIGEDGGPLTAQMNQTSYAPDESITFVLINSLPGTARFASC